MPTPFDHVFFRDRPRNRIRYPGNAFSNGTNRRRSSKKVGLLRPVFPGIASLIQSRLNSHESRIQELERRAGNSSPGRMDTDMPNFEDVSVEPSQDTLSPQVSAANDIPSESHSLYFANHQATQPQSHNFSMDAIDLGAPIATLRSLGALSNDGGSPESSRIVPKDIERSNTCDPVARGVLSSHDSKKAVNM